MAATFDMERVTFQNVRVGDGIFKPQSPNEIDIIRAVGVPTNPEMISALYHPDSNSFHFYKSRFTVRNKWYNRLYKWKDTQLEDLKEGQTLRARAVWLPWWKGRKEHRFQWTVWSFYFWVVRHDTKYYNSGLRLQRIRNYRLKQLFGGVDTLAEYRMPCLGDFLDNNYACEVPCVCRKECRVVHLCGEVTKIEELPRLLVHADASVRDWARWKLEKLQGGDKGGNS